MKKSSFLGALVVVGIAAAPGLAAAQRRIVIDPGHGGTDPGGTGNGLQEKTIVLDVATRFKSLLDADTADTRGGGSWTALRTRTSDVYVSLSARASYSNNQGADRFMSIHSNAFSDPAANGTETFAYAEGGTGAALRNLVQAEMISAWGLTNRGNKTANFAVLRDTAAPAVLHELAFITNTRDAAKLGSATERQKAAVAHLRAIQRHYGISPYLPSLAAVAPSEVGEASEVSEASEASEAAAADGAASEDEAIATHEGESAGCSTSAGSAGALSGLALLGLVGLRRRRR